MSIEFKEGEKIISTRDIFIHGKRVGRIHYRDESLIKYHASLQVEDSASGLCAGLAQGYGNTEIEAIEDAFRRGDMSVQSYTEGLQKLKDLYFLRE